jgi:DNA modification methylase
MKLNIKDIKLNSHNPRDITPEQFVKLKKSLQEFPQMLDTRPLVIDENNVVLGGNMRLRVLQELGFEEVPVKQVTGWTEEQKKEFIVKDNLSYGMWDWEMLANEWDAEQLEDWGLEIEGWEKEELEAQEDNFEVPDEIQTDIQLGDIIEIGEHRLMCGDSTDIAQVKKLMNGKKANMVFTDPPYGNGDAGHYGRGELGHRHILNDENFNVVNDFFNLQICNSYVFFLQWRTFKEALQTLENNQLQLKTIAVWDKKNSGLGQGMAEQWEAIIIAGDIKYSKFGGNVFTISREQKKRVDSPHPHQKPIELLNNLLKYFKEYNLLLDPFLGSGSTMVAAHQLNRKCYGMELDPKYCQVIVDRMKKLNPELVIKINGNTVN